MNIDEKKIPESTLPEHSRLPSQEQLTDEEMEQVTGGKGQLSLLNDNCPKCGTRYVTTGPDGHPRHQECPNCSHVAGSK